MSSHQVTGVAKAGACGEAQDMFIQRASPEMSQVWGLSFLVSYLEPPEIEQSPFLLRRIIPGHAIQAFGFGIRCYQDDDFVPGQQLWSPGDATVSSSSRKT